MVPIKEGWRVELIWRRLEQVLANRSRTSSSRPTALAWTNAAKFTQSMFAPLSVKEDYFDQRDYDIPTPSQNAIPDNFERDDNDNVKDNKFASRKIHLRPFLLPTRQMMVPKKIATYPSPTKRRLLTTMDARMRSKKICQSSANGTTHTPAPPTSNSDYSVQRDYNLPIPYQKTIPNDHKRNSNNDKKKFKK